MAQKTFEQRLNSPFFKYSKRIFDLIALNVIFCLISVLSCFVLFFPGLISLHKITYNFVNDIDEPVYKTFFLEIKKQWPFAWRLTLTCFSIILVIGVLAYFAYFYVTKISYDFIGWGVLVFLGSLSIVLLVIYLNLMLFNDYFKDDTFKMMIRKAALISLKKKLLSILNLIILVSFGIVLFIVPYIIPFISFSVYIYIIQAINKKSFIEIALEEQKRMEMEENLFLPAVIKEEEK